MKVTVSLNGTNRNPYHRMGLRQNPFPAIPKAEFEGANALLADLEARPIEDGFDLTKRLEGCTPEFLQLCLRLYRPGQMVRFTISWPTGEEMTGGA